MSGLSLRSGWLDAEGPLLFLRKEWRGGPRWNRVRVRFFCGQFAVALLAHSLKGGFCVAGSILERGVWEDMSYSQKEGWTLGWVKKLTRPSNDVGGGVVARDDEWVHQYPAVHEWLCDAVDADGRTRRTATLTLFAEGGAFKLFINDRASGASLCVTGSTVAGAFAALEAVLEEPDPPWRWYDRPRPGKGKEGRNRA